MRKMPPLPPFPALPKLPPLVDWAGQLLSAFQPPTWLVEEVQQRLVLWLNHVLMQEDEAVARLKRQHGRVVSANWQHFSLVLRVTPAGLAELAPTGTPADLALTLTDDTPWALAQSVAQGHKPGVRIEGDVQFAAEINWLFEHVRWDVAEDLARLIGDEGAHMLSETGRKIVQAVMGFAKTGPTRTPTP